MHSIISSFVNTGDGILIFILVSLFLFVVSIVSELLLFPLPFILFSVFKCDGDDDGDDDGDGNNSDLFSLQLFLIVNKNDEYNYKFNDLNLFLLLYYF